MSERETMSDEEVSNVWFGLGIRGTDLWVLTVKNNADAAHRESSALGAGLGCTATTAIQMKTAAQFAYEFKLWLADSAGVVGAEATDLVRKLGASMCEMFRV